MSSNPQSAFENHGASSVIERLIAAEGTAMHRYPQGASLREGAFASRNLADVVHYLCTLHGRYPGVIDAAATHTAHVPARNWLIQATDGFAIERQYMAQLAVAAGPMPSTPGQADSEAAIAGQRHALEMLANSDREGCALGAAVALVVEWEAIRVILDQAAGRWGVDAPECRLPGRAESLAVADAVATSAGIERAIGFGAQQLISQHFGLWDLLDARQHARGEY